MEEFDDLHKLVVQLKTLKKKARKLGIFTDDRELLECQQCGLKEDVTVEGFLFVYRHGAEAGDTGLRFPEPDDNGTSRCPGCGKKVKTEWL